MREHVKMKGRPKVVAKVTYLRKVNWSLLQAGIPLVWDLHLQNQGDSVLEESALCISVPNYLKSGLYPLPSIAPGKSMKISGDKLSWVQRDFKAAVELSCQQQTHLEIAIGSLAARCPLSLLTADEWCVGVGSDFQLNSTVELTEAEVQFPPGTVQASERKRSWKGQPPLQAATAALVLPLDDRVQQIKNRAARFLAFALQKRNVSLVHLPDNQKQLLVQALFGALVDLYPAQFHDGEKCMLEPWSQRIRLPQEALGEDQERRGATCVDLALTACGVLEAAGVDPLFVLAGAGNCAHAMIGCWTRKPQRLSPVLANADELEKFVDSGDLVLVDITEFATGNDYGKACSAASQQLNNLLYALDISSTREKWSIHPLPTQPAKRRVRLEPSRKVTAIERIVHPLHPAVGFQSRPELQRLHKFWRNHNDANVLGVVGIGGSGKSALVEHFLRLVREPSKTQTSLPPADLLFVWSFYESDSSEEALLALLEALGGSPAKAKDKSTCLTKIQQRFELKQGSRKLVVLDGLERIQEEGKGRLGRLRDEARPVRQFLRWAADTSLDIRVICTSRLPIVDLEDQTGGYDSLPLGDLPLQAARLLLRSRGVKGRDDQLDELLEEFGRHALLLSVIGLYLYQYHDGDVTKAKDLPPLREIGGGAQLDRQASRLARVLAEYENRLKPYEAGVLKLLSILRFPVEAAFLAGFRHMQRPAADITFPAVAELPGVLCRLTDLGLVQRERQTAQYSVHPAVGQHFYTAFREDVRYLHEGMGQYLAHQLGAHEVRVAVRGAVRTRGASLTSGRPRLLATTKEVLDLVEETIYHLCNAGMELRASRLYNERLGGFGQLSQLGEDERGLRITSRILSGAERKGQRLSPAFSRIRDDQEKFQRGRQLT
jgi:hypothetical protein